MLRLAAGQSTQPQVLVPAAWAVFSQTRAAANFLEIFSKERAKERQKKLKEEASRGYWDDFKELKDSKGKIFAPSEKLISASVAPLLPDSPLLRPDGSQTTLQQEVDGCSASLLCLAFRNGAEEMLASWSQPFGERFGSSSSQLIEFSIVESVVMSWWPFRSLIMRGRSQPAEQAQMPPKYLYQFSGASQFLSSLQLTNRLTGYAFLVDRRGRVRWRGCGTATGSESAAFLKCCDQLIQEDNTS